MVLWTAINISGDTFTIEQNRNESTIKIHNHTPMSILNPVCHKYTSISDLKEILNILIGEYAPMNNDYILH